MAMKVVLLLTAMGGMSLALVKPGFASPYYATYMGTASGIDTNGVFGMAGATLNGVAFTATYTYDPALFGNAVRQTSSNFINVNGGTSYGAGVTDPMLSASLKISGTTFNQSLGYEGGIALQENPAYVADVAQSSSVNGLENYGDVTALPVLSFNTAQSFSFVASKAWGDFEYNGEQILLTDTYVTISDVPPSSVTVSEPSSLPLVTGAAVVLLAIRGCRRHAAGLVTRLS